MMSLIFLSVLLILQVNMVLGAVYSKVYFQLGVLNDTINVQT